MKTVGDYIDNYRVIALVERVRTSAYQLYCVEPEAGSQLVLKIWPTVDFVSETDVATFARQAQALIDLHASSLLPIKAYDASHPYLILPYKACVLETLTQRIERSSIEPISEEEAIVILREVGTALVTAHQQGIVHGYLSPDSILLKPEGGVLVADFAPQIVRTRQQRLDLMPAYQPPEAQVSRLSDQYALATLARELSIPLTPSAEEVIAHARNEDPAQRFSTVREFLRGLGIEIPLVKSKAEEEPWLVKQESVKQRQRPDIPWSRIIRSKITRWSALAALLIMLLSLGISLLYPVLPAAAAIVTIVPMAISPEQSYLLTIAPQTNFAQQQIKGRVLTYTTSRLSKSGPVSGTEHINATQAHGQIVFSQITTEVKLDTYTSFQLQDGRTITSDDTTDMQPGFTYTVNAHINDVGSKSNIPADFVDGFYDIGFGPRQIGAPPDFYLSNPQPFTGGQDAHDVSIVNQSDVDALTQVIELQLEQQAQQAFQARLQPGESLLGNLSCTPHVQTQPAVGQPGANVTVTETMDCQIGAYDTQSAYDAALSDMKQQVVQSFGPYFALVGQLNLSVTSSAPFTNVLLTAQGSWQLLLDAAGKRAVEQAIAGTSQNEARAILLRDFSARITALSLTWWWGQHLPRDPGTIQIVSQGTK